MGLSPAELELLIQVTAVPWISSAHLAVRLGKGEAEVGQGCEALVNSGMLQSAPQGLSRHTTVFAPTLEGIESVAQALSMPAVDPAPPAVSPPARRLMRRMGLSQERFWALRGSLEIAQDINAVCAATAHRLVGDCHAVAAHRAVAARGDAPGHADWLTFIPKHFRKRLIFIHGKIAIHAADGMRAFYLLDDRGDAGVWHWYAHLKYLQLWARRKPEGFPPLLIVTTRGFRARALLGLGRLAGASLTILATAQRAEALRHGLRAAAWQILMPGNVVMPGDPFALPPIPRESFVRGVHAMPVFAGPGCRWRRFHAGAGRALSRIPPPDICAPPTHLHGLDRLEQLGDDAYRILTFVTRHPACPSTTVAAFLELPEAAVTAQLSALGTLKLVRRARVEHRRTIAAPAVLWSATDDAIRLRAAREMQDVERALRRHGFFRADALRRPFHTLAIHRFFERLKRDCVLRSRATRRLDTPPGQLNEGRIPFYDLAAYEAEITASDWYKLDGASRHWRPDGYGALRAGTAWSRFWIEIDGTPESPSVHSRAVWDGKLGRLCDYLISGRWQWRYPAFPQFLIVTTDLRNRVLIQDALVEAARARSVKPPDVRVIDAGQPVTEHIVQ